MKTKQLRPCLHCGILTKNLIGCTVSCANKAKPKRGPGTKCVDCGKKIPTRKDSKRCREHWLQWLKSDLYPEKDITLEEALERYSKHHRSSAFALVRARARLTIERLGLPKVCVVCGYQKHVEIAHKKPISSYPKHTLISVINSKENLSVLCRNCHWEFDRGLLSIPNNHGR